jgi:RimJ/RimL family protein N-acetyltransferase
VAPGSALETSRLVLRQFRESDWDAYARMSADEEVMRYIGTGTRLTRDEAWRSIANFLGHWQLRGYGMYAIESRETGELVGRAGIHDPPGWPAFELGWLLAREHWGRGYATEAARAVRDHAFGALGRQRISSFIRHGNERSARVAERIGEHLAGEVELLGSRALLYEMDRPA